MEGVRVKIKKERARCQDGDIKEGWRERDMLMDRGDGSLEKCASV